MEIQYKIIEFLKNNLVGNLTSSEYKIIYCPKHIVEQNIKFIDNNDYVIFHPNVAANNLSIVKNYLNSIVILKHRTLLLQKISERNAINENMSINHGFSIMYIESLYNDVTNDDWKLVIEPKIITINQLINNINNGKRNNENKCD